MTISIQESATLGTAISPISRHASSPVATLSPSHRLSVADLHHADDWIVDDGIAAYGPEEDHRSKLLHVTTLSPPYGPSVVDSHHAGYWTVDDAIATYGSEEDRRRKLLHRIMQPVSEPIERSTLGAWNIVNLWSLPRLTGDLGTDLHDPGGTGDVVQVLRGDTVSQNTRWLRSVPVSSARLSRIIESTKLIGHWYPDLGDALHDLDQAKEEAREGGFPAPPEKTLRNARRLLHAMYRISPWRFEVYPTPDGEIAIDAPGGLGRSVLLLCDSDGGALCLVNMNGAHRRARYSDTRRLPDGFVREALTELEQQRNTLAA